MNISAKPRAVREEPSTRLDLSPRLTVVGIGGAGCNAINNMIEQGLVGVEFIAANTDAQSLALSKTEDRLQLGAGLTEGLGAGSKPEIGEAAAEETAEEIRARLANSHMVFIAAGMGGGTGTGAASVIARIARELGVLTVGVVTTPFLFEGSHRMRIAQAGIEELKKYVDTLIIIPNQNLFRVAHEKTTFKEAFILADQVLYSGVACIVDLIIKKGLINLDFADVRTIMSGMGTAVMGTGEAAGERRAMLAAEEAISNPLLDDVSLKGAKGLLLSITGGPAMTLHEVDEAASRIREEVDPDANIIVGAMFDETLEERVRVSIVASGMSRSEGGARDSRAKARKPASAPSPEPRASPGASAHADPDDVYARLSAALNIDHPVTGTAARSPASTRPRGRGAWRDEGEVTIEDRLPDLLADEGADLAADAEMDSFGIGDGPQSPRMPSVEDFPAIAQREYRAKSPLPANHRETPLKSEVELGTRKAGFFGRLTGRGRG